MTPVDPALPERQDSPGSDPICRLIDRYVPWAIHDGLFSYQSSGIGPALPEGWKLHVSATQFSAEAVLASILPLLLSHGARFKVVSSAEHLTALNAGEFGLSQIGKFVTVYPTGDADAVDLARALDDVTSGLRGPRIPSDRPLRPRSLVHYRYGAMHARSDSANDGTGDEYPLRDAEGRMMADIRLPYYVPPPDFVADPFEAAGLYVPKPPRPALLDGRYLVVGALAQGLRGGVFRAVDLGSTPARLCLLKEAWHDVCLDALGRDARDWLANEERILTRHGPDPVLPAFYGQFELDGNRYIAIEYIEGTTLDREDSDEASDDASLKRLTTIGLAIGAALAHLHERGIVFRDLTPANIVETPDGHFRLIDFGIAHDLLSGDVPLGGGTPPFCSPQQLEKAAPTTADDIFAWGAVLHEIACPTAMVWRPAEREREGPQPRRPLAGLRPDLPEAVAAVIDIALNSAPGRRQPSMRDACERLAEAARGQPRPGRAISRSGQEGSAAEPVAGDEALRRARAIGDALCDAAEMRGGGLCWGTLSDYEDQPRFLPDLYSGAAGIALFLAELHAVTGASRYADAAGGAARWLAGPTWGAGRVQHGLHGGEPGIAYFFLRLAVLLGQPAYVAAAEMRMRRLKDAPATTIDLLHGTAGTILSLIALHRATGCAAYLEDARGFGDALIRAARQPDEGSVWDVPAAVPGGIATPLLGLLHGAAGIGLALATLADVTGDRRALTAARRAAALLLSQARPLPGCIEGGQPGAFVWPRRLGDASAGLQAHCHGAGGIAQFFMVLDRLDPDPRYRNAATGAVRAVASRMAQERSACACHGLAGTGHLLLDAYQAYGDRCVLAEAGNCAALLERFRDPERAGVYRTSRDGPISPDLMLGYAGIGSFLLRLSAPETLPELVLGRLLANDRKCP